MTGIEKLTIEDHARILFDVFADQLSQTRAENNHNGLFPEQDKYGKGAAIEQKHYMVDWGYYLNRMGAADSIARTVVETQQRFRDFSREDVQGIKNDFAARVQRAYFDLELVEPMIKEELETTVGQKKALILHRKKSELKKESLISIMGSIKNKQIWKLQDNVVTDYLTGLYNRRSFDKKMDEEVVRFKDRHNGHSVNLAIFDIDNFKDINDEYGHDFGDKVLKYVAEALQQDLRRIHHAARYGGEEFGLILTEISRDSAEKIVKEKVQLVNDYATQLFKEYVADFNKRASPGKKKPEFTGEITVSAGMSTLGDVSTSVAGMIRHADEALYDIKKNGKNGFRHYEKPKE
ncbi:MAG: GGDEF domain-containing protein [Nanoarchaeota archaeon]|nr:GGDEF domain-containing protein [Nanoarchaeota archaeon]